MTKTLLLLLLACASPAAQPAGRVMYEIKQVNRQTMDQLIDQLKSVETNPEVSEVWIRINTNGGDVNAGLDLIQLMDHYSKPITCVADVKAYSMGMSILEGCPRRLMTKRASLMMHEVLVQGDGGNQHELEDTANAVRVMSESLIQIAAARMKIDADTIRNHITGKQWWLDATEAVDVGAVDGIIAPADIPPVTELPKPSPSLLEILRGG